MSYGNGYAVFGKAPVFSGCAVSSDLAGHLDDIDRAEKRAEHVESHIDDAIDEMLDGTELTDLTVPIFDQQTVGRKAQPAMADLLKDDGANIDDFDDWLRILMRAPVEQLPFVALNFRSWAYDVLRENADSVGITELAEKLADDEAEFAREVAAEHRAGAL